MGTEAGGVILFFGWLGVFYFLVGEGGRRGGDGMEQCLV